MSVTLDDIRASYSLFFHAMNPSYHTTYFQEEILIPALERVVAGDAELKRLCNVLPFRHSKSDLGTVNFIPFYFGHNPTHSVMLLAYGKRLSRSFGRAIRDMMQKNELYAELFPDSIIRQSSRANDEFETVSGGKFIAGSFETGINGVGAQLVCIDDPCKNREEALSDTVMSRVRSVYTNVIRTRCEPDAAIVINSTRWTPNDLIGWRIGEEGATNYFTGEEYLAA